MVKGIDKEQKTLSTRTIVDKSQLEKTIEFSVPIKVISNKEQKNPYKVIRIKLTAICPNFKESGHLRVSYDDAKSDHPTTTEFCLSKTRGKQKVNMYDCVSELVDDHTKVSNEIEAAYRTDQILDFCSVLS